MKFYFSIICLFILGTSIAQNTPVELPDVIPPNPEVAAFFKNTTFQDPTSSGVIPISIPITTLENTVAPVSVSLSYNTGGIRVSEIASRVGLGWSLSTGGMVSRNPRGFPDDSSCGLLNNESFFNQFHNETDCGVRASLLDGGNRDLESDVYSYSFMGISGKVYVKPDGSLMKEHKNDDISIEFIKPFSEIKGWIITDNNGTKYYFGESNDTLREAINSSTSTSYNESFPTQNICYNDYTSTWHLLSIVDLQGNTIQFYYDSTSYTYANLGQRKKIIQCSASNSCNDISYNEYVNTVSDDNVARLTSIQSNNGRVDFGYETTQRQDLNGDYALKSIKKYNAYASTPTEHFELEYDYFIAPSQYNNNVNLGFNHQRRKRLYLEKLKRITSQETQEHIFDYYDIKVLPDRMSYAQDLWGFFNGNTGSFLPRVEYHLGAQDALNNSSITTLRRNLSVGGDRMVDIEFAKACSLKSITYPTGGSSEFSYESNTIPYESGHHKGNPFVNPLYKYIQTRKGQQTVLTYNSSTQSSSTYNVEQQFNLSDFPNKEFDITVTRTNVDCNANNTPVFNCPLMSVSVYLESQNAWFQVADFSFEEMYNDGVTTLERHILLPLIFVDEFGNAKFKIESTDNDTGDARTMSIEIKGRTYLQGYEKQIQVGGLRIKEHLKKDTNGQTLLGKEYSYEDISHPTSGYTFNPPMNLFREIDYLMLLANSFYPTSDGQGNLMNYTRVTAITKGVSNGKTEYEFSKYGDLLELEYDSSLFSCTIGGFPILFVNLQVPMDEHPHKRGLLLKQKVYKQNGLTSFTQVSETQNIYGRNGNDFIYQMNYVNNGSAFNDYYNYSERYYLKEQQSKTFFNGTQVTSTTKYTYDNGYSGRSFPIETETSTSVSNEKTVTKTQYPEDMPSSSVYQALITANRVAIPIETKTFKKVSSSETLLSTTFNEYGNIGGDYFLRRVKTAKGNGSLEERIVYHRYDDYGNPREISKKDGMRITYLWAYNGQYPVAKLENVSYTSIPSNLRDGVTNATPNDIATKLANLRYHFRNNSQVMVTTMIYDPLVGVTSITDPKGDEQEFFYDDFGRLEYVKDKQGKMLQEYEYNYGN